MEDGEDEGEKSSDAYEEIELPDDWGTLRVWAGQASPWAHTSPSLFQYRLWAEKPSDKTAGLVERHSPSAFCKSNSEETEGSPRAESEMDPEKYLKVDWSEYHYEPGYLYKSYQDDEKHRQATEAVEETRDRVDRILRGEK